MSSNYEEMFKERKLGWHPEEFYAEDCQEYFISLDKELICNKYGCICSNSNCQHGREKCRINV